jgi:hypothetical protein
MSQALRDAIASVRRVSHHALPEQAPTRAARGRYAPPRFDEAELEPAAFDLAESEAAPPFEDEELHEARLDAPAAAERFDDHALDDGTPLAGTYEDPQDSLEPADEWATRADWPDEPASLAEDAAPFDDGPDAPRRFGGRARPRRSSSNAPAGWSAPPGADAATEELWSDDGWDEDAPSGPQEASQGRVPVWGDVTQRPRLHLAALVLAPLFVLVAGLGLGILSGAQGFDRVLTTLGWTSLADGSAQTTPAPPAASSARAPTSGAAPAAAPTPAAADHAASPAQTAPSPPLSEMETVRVTRLPAPPKVESPADPRASDMPLPPPPKPAPWSSLSGEASVPSDRIEGADDAAAGAALPADGTPDDRVVADAAVAALEDDGVGGPFEPILIKSSASEPRVFVHYTEGGAGSTATALHLVRELRAAGFKVEERPVEVAIAESSIRYFFPGDRDEAEVLSAELQSRVPGGAEVTILDLTSYAPKPRQGHLEVWLGG